MLLIKSITISVIFFVLVCFELSFRNKANHEHFSLYPWLANSNKELELLRQLSEVCVLHLLPPEYSKSAAAFHFSRELLATCGKQKQYHSCDFCH